MSRVLALSLLASTACATGAADLRSGQSPSQPDEWSNYPARAAPAPAPPPPPVSVGASLADWAWRMRGVTSLARLSRGVPDDCTGLVRLAYWSASVELLGPEALASDNGVTAIYRHALALNAVHLHSPQPGDLVFFRETYDRNHDGKRNDGLTHVAIVTSVEPDGTVVFVHRAHGGVKDGRFNLQHPREDESPAGERWNDVLRTASRTTRAYLAGELFVAFASVDRLVAPTAGAALTARP